MTSGVPEKPSNVPQEAKWSQGTWDYVDKKNQQFLSWYKDGELLCRAELDVKLRLNGKGSYYSPEGQLIMIEKYENGEIKQRINYHVLHPSIQVPLNLPEKSIWDKDEKQWMYYNKDKNIIYTWYMNGEKKFIGTDYNDVEKGKTNYRGSGETWYYSKDGVLLYNTKYKDGEKNGVSVEYDKKGDIKSKEFYKEDELIWGLYYKKKAPLKVPCDAVWQKPFKAWCCRKNNKEYIYREDGTLKYLLEMNGNTYHGTTTAYYPDGKSLLAKGQYIKFKKHGKWLYYNMNGDIVKIEIYNMGKLVKEEGSLD